MTSPGEDAAGTSPGPAPGLDPHGAAERDTAPALQRALAPLSRFVLLVERLSMAIAGICFVMIVLITAVDVAMRYVFNAPLIWAFELISDYLMVAIFFLAIGATQRFNQNIGVDILVRRLPERPRAALAAACLVLVLGYIGLVGHAGWYVFADAWSNGDVLAGAIAWPRWPALLLVPIGCGLLVLRLIVDLIGNLGAAGGALDLAAHRRVRAIPVELGPVSRGEIA